MAVTAICMPLINILNHRFAHIHIHNPIHTEHSSAMIKHCVDIGLTHIQMNQSINLFSKWNLFFIEIDRIDLKHSNRFGISTLSASSGRFLSPVLLLPFTLYLPRPFATGEHQICMLIAAMWWIKFKDNTSPHNDANGSNLWIMHHSSTHERANDRTNACLHHTHRDKVTITHSLTHVQTDKHTYFRNSIRSKLIHYDNLIAKIELNFRK